VARTPSQRKLQPSHFAVNECWLVIKASQVPVRTDEEGSFDVYVLQDAASMFIFGTVLVSLGNSTAPEEEVEALFQTAWRGKRAWPKRLVLSNANPLMSSFALIAERNSIAVEYVPKSALSVYTDDVQAGFSEHFGRG
jgi:hypothetical protein